MNLFKSIAIMAALFGASSFANDAEAFCNIYTLDSHKWALSESSDWVGTTTDHHLYQITTLGSRQGITGSWNAEIRGGVEPCTSFELQGATRTLRLSDLP